MILQMIQKKQVLNICNNMISFSLSHEMVEGDEPQKKQQQKTTTRKQKHV